ncbi:MAG: dTMP kinase [Acidobacteria bacterium]|nr:dTMP kinase [Acidobacteriota bacterium]
MRGRFISFEGIDGSGKSTQLRLIAGDLRVRGFDVLTTMEPGGTPLGRRLREAFLETEENVSPLAELLLFAADRAQHVNFLIKPALEQGKIVLTDRYADATAAYQGAGRGFDEKTVEEVIALATGGLKPDLTVFFDVPIEKAILRTNSRSDSETIKNRMDLETAEFYTRVREAYLKIAAREKERFRTVDASGPIDEVHRRVSEIVKEFLEDTKDAGDKVKK